MLLQKELYRVYMKLILYTHQGWNTRVETPGLKLGQCHWPGWPTDPDSNPGHTRIRPGWIRDTCWRQFTFFCEVCFARTATCNSEHFESSFSIHRIKHDSSLTAPTLKGTARLTRFEIAAMLYFLSYSVAINHQIRNILSRIGKYTSIVTRARRHHQRMWYNVESGSDPDIL